MILSNAHFYFIYLFFLDQYYRHGGLPLVSITTWLIERLQAPQILNYHPCRAY